VLGGIGYKIKNLKYLNLEFFHVAAAAAAAAAAASSAAGL